MRAAFIFKYILILSGILLFSACQEEQTIEPHGVTISFHAVTGLKSSSDTLIIEEAYMGVGGIDLLRDGEADSAFLEKIVYDGPYVVNLMNGTASPAIKWIFAEPGHYRKIAVSTYNALPQGNTIVLKGYIQPDGTGEEVPFEFITSENYTLEIENNAGITVREGENLDLMVVFDLSDLFSGTDLTKLEKDERGVVMISDDENFNSAIAVMNTFETFSSFGIDDGLPFPGAEDGTPENEVPGNVDNPDEQDQEDGNQDENEDVPDEEGNDEEDSGNGDSGDNPDDEQDDSSSGNDSGGSYNGGGGATDENEDDGSSDDEDPGSENENPSDGEDDNPEEDEGAETGNGNEDEEPDSDSGNTDDESDAGSENPDDEDADDDDSPEESPDGDDDGDDDTEEGDDDSGDDGDDEDEGKGNQSDKNKDKGKGKGDKGKGKG